MNEFGVFANRIEEVAEKDEKVEKVGFLVYETSVGMSRFTEKRTQL
jgi:hypothetical protein